MTIDLNSCRFVGRVVQDPEFMYTPKTGAPLAKLSIAINRGYTDRESGEAREFTDYVDFKLWNAAAAKVAQFVSKGTPIYLCGELRTEKWTDAITQQPRSRVFIHVRDVRDVVILDADGNPLDPQPEREAEANDEAAAQEEAVAAAPAPTPAPVVVAPPVTDPPRRPAKRRPKAEQRYVAAADEDLPF